MLIAEIRHPLRAHRSDADGAAHRPVGFERPVNAAGVGVERIDLARVAAGEDAPSHHGGLRVGLARAGEAEGPLQLQLRHLLRAQARHVRGLHAAIGGHPHPSRSNKGRRTAYRKPARARHSALLGRFVAAESLAAGDEHGHRARLRGRERLALFRHLAGGQRRQDALGSEQAQREKLRRAAHAFIVALRAMLLVDRRSGAAFWATAAAQLANTSIETRDAAINSTEDPPKPPAPVCRPQNSSLRCAPPASSAFARKVANKAAGPPRRRS